MIAGTVEGSEVEGKAEVEVGVDEGATAPAVARAGAIEPVTNNELEVIDDNGTADSFRASGGVRGFDSDTEVEGR